MFKFLKIFFYSIVIVFFIFFLLSRGHVYKKDELEYGITFSKAQAIALKLDWQKTFLAILEDLNVKKIRLSAYWNEIEAEENKFDWTDTDWQINEASRNNAEIILAIGARLPRWPECHLPEWAKNTSQEHRDAKLLEHIQRTIERYKDNKNIVAWQIENEPFLSHFGDCTGVDKNLLDQEIAVAKEIDTRPIVVTDSGELSFWVPAAKRADIFGTTMYLNTYSLNLRSYVKYPISPDFFHFKKNIANLFAHPKKWIIIELQAEPWAPLPYQFASQEERDKTMNLEKFKNIINFSAKTGFKEIYLWGAEWWYWEKEIQSNPEMWEEAKRLFNK